MGSATQSALGKLHLLTIFYESYKHKYTVCKMQRSSTVTVKVRKIQLNSSTFAWHRHCLPHPRGKNFWYPVHRRLGEPRSRSGRGRDTILDLTGASTFNVKVCGIRGYTVSWVLHGSWEYLLILCRNFSSVRTTNYTISVALTKTEIK
jgi:hypothetical protein